MQRMLAVGCLSLCLVGCGAGEDGDTSDASMASPDTSSRGGTDAGPVDGGTSSGPSPSEDGSNASARHDAASESSSSDGGSAPDNPMGNTRRTSTADGSFVVAYQPEPAPIPVGDLFALQIEVYGSNDASQPLEGATVAEIGARMPKHDHGMNTEPVVEKQSPGAYRVEGMKFHMPGTEEAHWVLSVTVEKEGTTDEARFEIVTANR